MLGEAPAIRNNAVVKGDEMTRKPTIEKYEDKAGEWRWRLKAGNGQIIATSGEGYDSESNVDRAIDTVSYAFAEVYAFTEREKT